MSRLAAPYTWDGAALRPLPAFAPALAKRFAAGEVVALELAEERSSGSHRHYFACVREAWVNLPARYAAGFPSEEHLRKYALIKAGYCDQRAIVCPSRGEARRTAAVVKPMDDYAVVSVAGRVVSVFTAKSQAAGAMGRARFQASKEAVLDVLAEMIGVDPAALVEAGRRSAA